MPPPLPDAFDVSPEVAQALAAGGPVVALESAIVTHGMPYPTSLDCARSVEAAIRAAGATPATVALLAGRVRVGLDDAELAALAQGGDLAKLSLRDLPVAVARGRSGGTTVAATAALAARAGVGVFVTGGIGGVHRGAAATFDVSADLTALARTDIAVVCAGAKTILDVAATLELLETLGVTVVGYQTDTFPGFYLRATGGRVDVRADSVEEVAALVRARRDLGLPGATVVAVPIPAAAALGPADVEALVAAALAEADRRGVRGRDVTPFLLARLEQQSQGRTLEANVALVLNNARVGAALARALARG